MENYADKWLTKPQRRAAFFKWHPQLVTHFDDILESLGEGSDRIHKRLANCFGEVAVNKAVIANSESRLTFLEQGKRGVQRHSGLITPTATTAAYLTTSTVKAVPRHTNFGR